MSGLECTGHSWHSIPSFKISLLPKHEGGVGFGVGVGSTTSTIHSFPFYADLWPVGHC